MKDGRRWIVLYNNVINGPSRPTSPLLPTTPTVPTGLNKVYTLMPTTGNTSVFAGHTETRVGTLPATFLSRAIAVDPVRNVVYVAPGEAPNMISVYSAETEKVIKHITVKSLFPSPEAIALNLKTNRVYIGTLTGQLFVINGHTFTQEKLIGKGQFPCRLTALAVNAKSNVVYVVSGGGLSNELNIVNGSTNEVLGPFTEGLANPSDVLVDERTNLVYVSNYDGGTVSIYDGDSLEFLDEILVGGSPKQMELDPVGNAVYVTNGDGYITVLDVVTNTIANTVTTRRTLVSVALNPYTRRAYLAYKNRKFVDVMDMDQQQVIRVMPLEAHSLRIITLP